MAVPICPGCGQQLAPVAGDPASAPWLCGPSGCSQGFWPSELSRTAQGMYQRRHRGFGSGAAAAALRDQVSADVAAAAARGTSALPEHLPLLPLSTLQRLAGQPGLSAQFAALVAAAITSKGA